MSLLVTSAQPTSAQPTSAQSTSAQSTSVAPVRDGSDLFTAARPRPAPSGWTTPRTAFQSLLAGDTTLLDVRSPAERAAGTVPLRLGVTPVSGDQLSSADSGAAVIVLAADDELASRTARSLRQRGFDASALRGGLAAWRAAGMPVID